MAYCWDDFSLDRKGSLLTRQGQQFDVSRKVLDCINHLVVQRHRVVGCDELIREIWGHDNVTNHQLSQVILASRRALGDDGQTQRLIRTIPGLGYRWVGAVSEIADTAARVQQPTLEASPTTPTTAALQQQAPEVSPRTDVEATSTSQSGGRKLRVLVASGLALMTLTIIGWRFQDAEPVETTAESTIAATTEPLARLEEQLWRGNLEAVREGLATLPVALADSPEGRMLEIKLDMKRSRYERAAHKLSLQKARSEAAADRLWQVELLTLQSSLDAQAGKAGREILRSAQQAISLLESMGDKAPPPVLGEALSARGVGFLRLGQLQPAMSDLVRARDILLQHGERNRATTTRRMLAHAWLRMGRLTDALDEINQIATLSAQLQNPSDEVIARNAATRIQIELLKWDEAIANSRRSMQVSRKFPDSTPRLYTIKLHALVLTNTGHLREAASLLEETETGHEGASGSVMYLLASGNAESAVANSAAMFAEFDPTSNTNLILSSQEGAMLLWMTAAQDLAAAGRPMPNPSPAQHSVLQNPQSIPGRIARGRWLWSKGMRREAEAELRLAFDQSMKTDRLFHMTLAAEALIGLLLQNDEVEAADAVLTSMRALNPDRMDRDYRVRVLSMRTTLAKRDVAKIEDAQRLVPALAEQGMASIKPHSQRGLMDNHRADHHRAGVRQNSP